MAGPAALLSCSLLLAGGCRKDSPTEPGQLNPRLTVTCQPSGPQVSCLAILSDVPGLSGDVTSRATWLVSDASAGSFGPPGLFVPSRRGEVTLWARFQQWEDTLRPSFLVDPAAGARRLYWLSGTVTDDASRATIAGATVRILDGYSANAEAVTNSYGVYRVDRILTGETFTASASASGYQAATQSYRVDPPEGYAGSNPPFLDFRLHRLP